MKQNEILQYNTEALKANSIRKDEAGRIGSKSKM